MDKFGIENGKSMKTLMEHNFQIDHVNEIVNEPNTKERPVWIT